MRPSAVLTLALMATAALGGCALAINGPKPDAPISEVPRCDTGKGGVFADGALGTILGVAGAAVIADGSDVGAGIATMAIGGLLLASAARGNGNANRCEKALEEHDLYVQKFEEQRFAEQAARERRSPVASRPVAAPAPATATAPAAPATGAHTTTPPAPPAAGEPTPISPFDNDAPYGDDAQPPASPPETDWSAFWELLR